MRWGHTALVCLVVGLVGCNNAATGPTITLNIAASVDQTGTSGSKSWVDTLNMAMTDLNAGLATAKSAIRFALVLSDSVNTPTITVPKVIDAVQNQKAIGVITDTSQDDVAINMVHYDADATNDLNVPIVGSTVSSPLINNPAAVDSNAIKQAAYQNAMHWNFRVTMSSAAEAKAFVAQALSRGTNGDVDGNGTVKIAVYYTNEASGKGLADAIAATMAIARPDAKVELIGVNSSDAAFNVNTHDFAADMKLLTDDKNETTGATDGPPDFICETAFPQIGEAIMKAYLDGGYSTFFFHPHGFRTGSITSALGAAINGQEGISYIVTDGTSGAAYATQFQSTYGYAATGHDSNFYDCVSVLSMAALTAIRGLPDASKVTGAQVRDAISQLNTVGGEPIAIGAADFAKAAGLIAAGKPINLVGASGPLDFDANGNVLNKLVHWRIVNSTFTDVELFDCTKSPDCPLTPL